MAAYGEDDPRSMRIVKSLGQTNLWIFSPFLFTEQVCNNA